MPQGFRYETWEADGDGNGWQYVRGSQKIDILCIRIKAIKHERNPTKIPLHIVKYSNIPSYTVKSDR